MAVKLEMRDPLIVGNHSECLIWRIGQNLPIEGGFRTREEREKPQSAPIVPENGLQ
jgi:hypothetical protein